MSEPSYDKRKTKRDKKSKGTYSRYKKGGRGRAKEKPE
jgi:hypothetical protein